MIVINYKKEYIWGRLFILFFPLLFSSIVLAESSSSTDASNNADLNATVSSIEVVPAQVEVDNTQNNNPALSPIPDSSSPSDLSDNKIGRAHV